MMKIRFFPLFVASILVVDCRASSLTTYNLYFDGILKSPHYWENENEAAGELTPVPVGVVTDLSASIMDDIIQEYSNSQLIKQADGSVFKECEPEKVSISCKTNAWGGSCIVQHSDNEMHIHMSAYFQSHHETTSVRCEATVTASQASVARDLLVRAVPIIDRKLGCKGDPVWSIQHQPSVLELMAKTRVDSVTSAQEDKDCHAASLEELLLSKPYMKNRKRLDSISKDYAIEIWSYQDDNFYEPVKALFVDGYLSETTSLIGTAHAEALVHPVLVAHPSPERVLIISLTPLSIVKEVLKYKSIEHVSVLGSDAMAINLVKTHMPNVNDCSFLMDKSRSCIDAASVEVIEEDLEVWLDRGRSCSELYDVVLVDVAIAKHEWLSVNLYDKLNEITSEKCGDLNSVQVVSSGSAPSLFEVDTETILSPREALLRQASRHETDGGLENDIVLYDEPLAKPLSSTYIVMFAYEATSYRRFLRRNAPAIDVDIVNRLHPGVSQPWSPTLVYDGPTHLSYLAISKAWENWYCNTLPGRNLPVCKSFLPKWFNASYHSYGTEVKKVPVRGRSLYATEDIPKGNFILPNDAALGIHIDRDQWEALNKFVHDFPEADQFRQFRDFILAYGFEAEPIGRTGWSVSIACNNSFTNHACTKEEETVETLRDVYFTEDGEDDVDFSPPVLRRSDLLGVLAMASRDVVAGEELMIDYRCFRDQDDTEFNAFLEKMCSDGVGLVHDAVDDD